MAQPASIPAHGRLVADAWCSASVLRSEERGWSGGHIKMDLCVEKLGKAHLAGPEARGGTPTAPQGRAEFRLRRCSPPQPAYSLSEVDKKTLEFRKEMTTPIPVAEDASEFEKFRARAYETAMKVPVAAIELYLEIRARIEDHVVGFTEPASDKLLPDLHPDDQNIFTLVVDLTDTLVCNDWQDLMGMWYYDTWTDIYVIKKRLQVHRERGWKTFKRPGVEAFLQHMATMYEVVVYSDQVQMYVDPVVERLDSTGQIRKLSRPATKYQDGKHYRDLSKLNRNPAQVLYVSAHALESCLQPENCVTVKPWKLETDDTELLDLIPFLEYLAIARPSDIRAVLASYQGHDVAKEFRKRSKELERMPVI
uniref:Mitochondrial import inner membrane translocase subunit TIM50 n=1 Tax=Aegilops tauschii TaxID=37682 RepID=M8BLP5_AEGTA